MSKFCKKRNEIVKFPTATDYCVDCDYFDNYDCWVCELPVKYQDGTPKIIKVNFNRGEE